MSGVIEPKENGPYVVKSVGSVTNAEGEDISAQKDMVFLCRCGQSNNKPYCDGTHKKVGFVSASENPKLGKWKNYVGKQITIHDNRRLCAHAGECTHGLASVWRMGEKPWIDPDGADVEAIIAVIEKCPSGALGYTIEGKPSAGASEGASVIVSKNGPYHVSGAVSLDDSSVNTEDIPDSYALCRCGASKNKPFCDGSHWDINFSDGGE
ncbi:MAG: CDGSH iron-sulfur domain-containing protein [bacterium]